MTAPASGPPTTTHFTYKEIPSRSLEQGDVLGRSKALLGVLEQVHPYLARDQYTHYLVLTQSCDLVQRGSAPCRAPYITLAAVRPLDDAVLRELSTYQDPFEERVNLCAESKRYRLKQFLERVLDNNEKAYFYLHPDAARGLPQPSCAFLRVSVALKRMHYRACLDARILSIADVFQAKLGWLLGGMYSQVGTPEWHDQPTVSQFNDTLERQLFSACQWVPDAQLTQAKRNLTRTERATLPPDEARSRVESTVVPSTRASRVLLRLDALLTELKVMPDDLDTAEQVRQRIARDSALHKLLSE